MKPAVALLLALLIILTVRVEVPRARRELLYWWFLTAFGWRAAAYAWGISHTLPSGNTGVLVEFGPMLAVGLVYGLRRLSQGGRIDAAGSMLLVLILFSLAFSLARQAALMPVLAAMALLPAVLGRQRMNHELVNSALIDSLRFIAATLLYILATNRLSTFGTCRLDKCSTFGVQLGREGDTNALGICVAAVGVLASLVLVKHLRAILLLMATAVIVDLCASRSALVILLVGAVATVGTWSPLFEWTLNRLMFLGLAVSLTYLAFHTWSPTQFTGRAQLWLKARSLISDHPWFGYGSSFWVGQSKTTDFDPNYATHNLLLELLLATGTVGTVLTVLAVWMARHRDTDRRFFLVSVCIWLAGGLTEVTAAPPRLYVLPAVFTVIFISGSCGRPTLSEGPASTRGWSMPAGRPMRRVSAPSLPAP